MKFHLISLGSRPLLAIPSHAPRLRQAAIDCYPAHTRKKRLVRVILQVLSRVGLIGRAFPARPLSLPGVGTIDFEAWMGSLCQQLEVSEACPVLVWPADPARGRIYLYLLDLKGDRVGFCKLGLDARNNNLIERERQALIHLQSMQLRHSRIPKLLASGDLKGASYIVAEMTPRNTRISDWHEDPSLDRHIAEYAGSGRLMERAEIEALPWWSRIREKYAHHLALMNEVAAAVDQGVEVCLVHGDLNCTNVLRNGNEVWLLDWEQSDRNAPCLTDQVCVAVDQLWLDHHTDPAASLRKLMQLFPVSENRIIRARVVMALAYLGSVGFTPAIAIIDAWFPTKLEIA